ncbi:hypothetical protein HAX54_004478, partial [Datura stramonium]|nr:hypothetical protein [Datura stramonium]
SPSEILQQRNDSCRPGAGVTGEVMVHHTSDGGSDSRQLDDGLSDSIESGPFNLRVMELSIDRQMSDGPSWQPSPKPSFPGRLYQCDARGDDWSIK